MTEILKGIGIILKKKKFRETSLILTVYSREAGKINLIVKGARTKKSKLTGLLDTLNIVEYVYYSKEKRNLQFLSSCYLLDGMNQTKANFDKLKTSLSIIEILDKYVTHNEKNVELFILTSELLLRINHSTDNSYFYLISFLLNFSRIYGYSFFSSSCNNCDEKMDDYMRCYFERTKGIICSNCKDKFKEQVLIKNNLMNFISRSVIESSSLDLFQLTDSEKAELFGMIFSFYNTHFENFKDLKSFYY